MSRTILAVCALLLVPRMAAAERPVGMVAGVVEEADSYWKGNLIHTDYVLRAGDERIAFTLPGGTIGDETHGTSWSIPLEKGERYLLFLGDEGSPPIAVPEDRLRAARAFFSIRNPAVPPIVVNPVPSSFSPYGRDQAAYWNVYAPGLFQIKSPSAAWSFGDGVSDIAGLVDDARMEAEFGDTWFPGALSRTTYRLKDGHIVEADIALNPAVSWTLDEDKATRLDGPQSYRHAILNGLGFAWGLIPSFSLSPRDRESVVGLAGKPYKLATLFSDDTAAARAAFGGARIRDGLISAYSIQPAPGHARQVPLQLSPASVPSGGSVKVVNPVKIENTGTEELVNPAVEVYLVPRRFSMEGAVLLKRIRVKATVAPRALRNVEVGKVTVPGSVAPGSYFVAFQLRAAGDQYKPNDFAWSDSNVVLTVKSR